MDKKEYITKLATFLIGTKTTMPVDSLALLLNWNGYTTEYGTPYQGKRGTYTLVKATYDWLVKNGRKMEADNVAQAFPKPDGSYAYR